MKKKWMKSLRMVLLALALALLGLAGCSTEEPKEEKGGASGTVETVKDQFPITFKDESGQKVTIKEKPQKIVSVLPSTTETLFALGLDKEIAGVSDFDNYPKQAAEKQKVGSQDINLEAVLSLAPDVAFISEYHAKSHADMVKQMQDAGIAIVVNKTSQNSFSDTYKSIEMIAKATGTEKQAAAIIDQMKNKVEAIKEKAKEVKEKKLVWTETSPQPDIYTAGKHTFVDEMLTIIGAENLAASQDGWVKMNEEEVVKLNPDVIITTYGYYVPDDKKQVLSRQGWQEVQAVKDKQVYDVNSDLVSRPGPRLADGLEALAKAVYPDVYQ